MKKLESLRTILHMEHYSPEDDLEQLEDRKRHVARECDATAAFDCVERSGSYDSWFRSTTSQIFVLSGRNGSRATYCWLSPVAMKLIAEKTREADQNPTSICIPVIINLRNEKNTFEHITRSLVYRLLLKAKKGFSKTQEVEKLDREMEKYSRLDLEHNKPMHKTQETLANILAQSLALFNLETTIWIIIDRADQCRLPQAEDRGGLKHQQRRALLRSLVTAVEKSQILLKVLVIVNTTDWDVQKQERHLGQEKEGSLIIETFEDENQSYEIAD